jgi:DNA-directed RNA polymerase specialized sigma24 family protein
LTSGRDSKQTDRQGIMATAIPVDLEILLLKTISLSMYPQDLFPRLWFPDLDGIIVGLFRKSWETNFTFRESLSDVNEIRVAERMVAELSLEAILARHPRTLVMIYKQMISGFIQRLHRRQDERQDIVQEVFARLLSGKLANIQKKYDSNFKEMPTFTSYFMVCIRNMYVDIVREGRNLLMKRDDVPLRVLESASPGRVQACSSAFLDEEFAKLRVILQLHPANRDRIALCLKLKCRLAVTATDVRHCFPACSADDIQRICADFRNMKDREMYKAIVPVFNRHESKPVQADTLRKWVENNTHSLIAHLNRIHRETVYDKENISILLSLFFTEENARAQN